MRDWIQMVLERYGQAVRVERAGEYAAERAFLQPVIERGEQVPDEMTEIGWLDGRLWLYLGQAEVEPGDVICWNGMEFRVRSSRPYPVGETLLYWWASLEQAREAAE